MDITWQFIVQHERTLLLQMKPFLCLTKKSPDTIVLKKLQHLAMTFVIFSLLLTFRATFFLLKMKPKQIMLYSHSMDRVNLNKSEELVTNTTTASKYIPKRSRICINRNPTFQTSLHKIFKKLFFY